ncbi:MAG TPA: hypothetical protein EYP56_13505 [Planctomycetaceae bacterium]|nr:hypothetical protein [Planctomycetaceae bacterium]
MRIQPLAAGWVLLVLVGSIRGADSWQALLGTLRAAGPEGKGSVEAAAAWRRLVQADADVLPQVLEAIDGADPLAANWLRTAVDAIAERQVRRGGPLPVKRLEAFLLDTGHDPKARRLAYELLCQADPSAPERLLPGMLDDPSLEIRRDAVARLIQRAEGLEKAEGSSQAVRLYWRALTAARDLDQIRLLARRLRQAGQTVDLARHFGFIVRWKLIGPFDNTDRRGLDTAYPPEEEIDFAATYDGKHGPVRWIDYQTSHAYGKVDLNAALVEEKEVVGYAAAEFRSDRRREVQLRLATPNAAKVWLNGQLLARYPIYHAGFQMDQYSVSGTLRAGRNVILVKICQNEQTQDWARDWVFQLRVCDRTGGGIRSTGRP